MFLLANCNIFFYCFNNPKPVSVSSKSACGLHPKNVSINPKNVSINPKNVSIKLNDLFQYIDFKEKKYPQNRLKIIKKI